MGEPLHVRTAPVGLATRRCEHAGGWDVDTAGVREASVS
jgi:hypothetical protein